MFKSLLRARCRVFDHKEGYCRSILIPAASSCIATLTGVPEGTVSVQIVELLIPDYDIMTVFGIFAPKIRTTAKSDLHWLVDQDSLHRRIITPRHISLENAKWQMCMYDLPICVGLYRTRIGAHDLILAS